MNWAVYYLLIVFIPFASIFGEIKHFNTQLHLINNTVDITDGSYHEEWLDVTVKTPQPILLKRSFDSLNSTWTIEPHSEGPISISRDDQGRILEVSNSLGWVHFKYASANSPNTEIETSDEQKIRYQFNHPAGLLTSVVKPLGEVITYEYQVDSKTDRYLLTRRQESSGYYLETHYWNNSVVEQLAPAGHDESPVVITQFKYFPTQTDVIDAKHHKTVYHFSPTKKVTAIEKWLQNAPYKIDHFAWQADHVTSHTVTDGSGSIVSRHTYTYDDLHNLTSETLSGNLTGTHASKESYTTTYAYKGKHLTTEYGPNGKKTSYVYADGTDNIIAKLVWDSKTIRLRTFYTYDTKNCITKVIEDDGYSPDAADLKGVTQRTIKAIIPRTMSPGFGLPQLIDEKYLDLSTGQEKLLRTTLFHYDTRGNVARKELYDADGNGLEWEQFSYDAQGHITSKTDAKGTCQIAMDSSGRTMTSNQQTQNKQITRTCTYDFSQRLIAENITDCKGRTTHTTHRYNALGQKIATVDFYGNETSYEYDELGRQVKIVYPQVTDGSGSVIRPTITYTYDVLDNVISCTDANGYTSDFKYNIRGQPTHVTHPDGSHEHFFYNLDGSLERTISRSGFITLYSHDFLGRAVQKTQHGSNGSVQTTSASYSAFHLNSVINPSGVKTVYTYDSTGRVKSEEKGGPDGLLTEINYESNNRISSKEWYGHSPEQYSQSTVEKDPYSGTVTWKVTDGINKQLLGQTHLQPNIECSDDHLDLNTNFVNQLGQKVLQKTETDSCGYLTLTTYDAIGRVIEVEKLDNFGTSLSCHLYRYDAAGNKVWESTDAKYAIRYSYGPLNRLESTTEGDAPATVYSYDNKGQLVSLTKTDGTALNYVYDGFGRLARLSASDGSVEYLYHYDQDNCLTDIEDTVHLTTTTRQFDMLGNLLSERLANGLEIHNTFDRKGRLTQVTLPDKSSIQYEYESALLRAVHRLNCNGDKVYSHAYAHYGDTGELLESTLIGSLGSARFKQDPQGHRTSIETSYWNETIQDKSYDCNGHLLQVRYNDPNGIYSCRYAYDANGRLIAEGGVEMLNYTYDSRDNRSTKGSANYQNDENNRILTDSQATFNHDSNGNLISRTQAGLTTHYTYDALDRLTAIENPGSQRVEYRYDAFNRRLSKRIFTWTPSGNWLEQHHELYLYQGSLEIGAANTHGELHQLRVLGSGIRGDIGASVAIEINERVYAPIHDHRGSVTCLVDMLSHEIAEFYRYSAFGEETVFDNEGKPLTEQDAINPWRFSSKRCDPESGFVYFGRRYYDPNIGRWISKDPQGTPDGLNRYSFVKNDPVTLVDPKGLFSFQAVWQTVTDTLWDCLRPLGSSVEALIDFIQTDVNLITDLREDLEFLGHQLIGPGIYSLIGFKVDNVESGVYGRGEVSDLIRISHINGILTYREECLQTVTMISDFHGGTNVHYVFRPTDGWSHDIINAILIKFGFTSYTAAALTDKWTNLIDEMGGTDSGGLIIHYAHSLGGVETSNARHMMTPSQQTMIRVFTLGSPTMLSSTGFESVTNYVSRRDGVCLLDPVGYVSALLSFDSNVIFIGSWYGIPFVDHVITNENYSRTLAELGLRFLNQYGSPREK